jgi:antitoxin HicB
MNDLKYPAAIRPLSEAEGGGYMVEFPDLPGCVADGESLEDALKNAEDALGSWIKTAEEFGDKIPEPSLPTNFSGRWQLRVPKSLHAALVLRAKQEGVSLNTLTITLLAQSIGGSIKHGKQSFN